MSASTAKRRDASGDYHREFGGSRNDDVLGVNPARIGAFMVAAYAGLVRSHRRRAALVTVRLMFRHF
jgi:hypothetical protein